MSERIYPYKNFKYQLEMEGLNVGGFSEVSGFDAAYDVIEYREGNMPATPMKMPGLIKYGNVTLKKGVTNSTELFQWLKSGLEGGPDRKTVTLTLLDEAGAPAAAWRIMDAWPMKYNAPDFNASGSEVAVESLELAHEGMDRIQWN
jgi:phage tail-like protein